MKNSSEHISKAEKKLRKKKSVELMNDIHELREREANATNENLGFAGIVRGTVLTFFYLIFMTIRVAFQILIGKPAYGPWAQIIGILKGAFYFSLMIAFAPKEIVSEEHFGNYSSLVGGLYVLFILFQLCYGALLANGLRGFMFMDGDSGKQVQFGNGNLGQALAYRDSKFGGMNNERGLEELAQTGFLGMDYPGENTQKVVGWMNSKLGGMSNEKGLKFLGDLGSRKK